MSEGVKAAVCMFAHRQFNRAAHIKLNEFFFIELGGPMHIKCINGVPSTDAYDSGVSTDFLCAFNTTFFSIEHFFLRLSIFFFDRAFFFSIDCLSSKAFSTQISEEKYLLCQLLSTNPTNDLRKIQKHMEM